MTFGRGGGWGGANLLIPLAYADEFVHVYTSLDASFVIGIEGDLQYSCHILFLITTYLYNTYIYSTSNEHIT